MKASLSLVLLLGLGCGGGSQSGKWTTPPHDKSVRTVDQWTTADEDQHLALACTNIVAPNGTLRCESLVKAGLTPDRCRPMLEDWRTSATDGQQRHAFRLVLAGLALADSCEMVEATFRIAARVASAGQREQAAAAGCMMRDDNSRALTAEQADARRGAKDTHFADTTSSAAEPIEVCGVKGELEWLTHVQCADGSHPFGDDKQRAHGARIGSTMGPSTGACGAAPLDKYAVTCPEKSYEVYMNMYMCGPGEHL